MASAVQNGSQVIHEPEQPDASRSSSRATWLFRARLMGALALPIFLETLDYTVVATAQPHIASAFNRLDLQTYIGTIYVLASTVFMPLYASFADIFGRHWAMQMSIVFFMIGSAISTGAQNMAMMLAGRGIAGIGAAGLLTVVRTILADSGSLDENNWQSAILIVLYAVGYSVGPIIGGALTSVNFRWVFGINLPCCALSLVLVFLLLHKRVRGPQPPRWPHSSGKQSFVAKIVRVDFVGGCLFIAGGICVLLALNWGSTSEWKTARVIACFTVGGLLIILCIVWEYILERKQESGNAPSSRIYEAEPMIPIEVFRSYDVVATSYGAFAAGMLMLVAFYFLAVFFVIVIGYSPTKAGVQLVYFAPGMGGGVVISTQMIRLLRQPKYPIILGTAVMPIAVGLLSRALALGRQGEVNGYMVMCGVGVGLNFSPLAMHARFSQPAHRIAIVIALGLFFRMFGGLVGLAQCAAVLNSKVRSYIENLIRSGAIDVTDFGGTSFGTLGSINQINSLPPAVAQHVRDAFQNGVRWSFISLIPWLGIAFFMVLFLSKIPDTDRGEHRGEDGKVNKAAPATDVEKAAGARGSTLGSRRVQVSSSAGANADGAQATPPPPPKPRWFGPIGLIIYGIRWVVWKLETRKAAKSAAPPTTGV